MKNFKTYTIQELLTDPEIQEEGRFMDRVMQTDLDLYEVCNRPFSGNVRGDDIDEHDLCGAVAKFVRAMWWSVFCMAGAGERVSKEMLKLLPHVPAVYFLNAPLDGSCNRWKTVYIGKASDLHHRWNNNKHHRLDEAVEHDCRMVYWPVHRGTEGLIEAALIYEFRPAWNERQ